MRHDTGVALIWRYCNGKKAWLWGCASANSDVFQCEIVEMGSGDDDLVGFLRRWVEQGQTESADGLKGAKRSMRS